MSQSKNVSRADNQQERLIEIGWIVGFVDGEGCFSINFVKQPNRNEKTRIRKGYKTGYQITHEFVVAQGKSSLESVEKLKNYFNVGGIYINRRHDNHREDLYRYCVRKREDLINVIIPFFKKYKLHTAKKKDFDESFKEAIAFNLRMFSMLGNSRGERIDPDALISAYSQSGNLASYLNEKVIRSHKVCFER